MTSVLVEIYDEFVLEKNVYQAFVRDSDEILFLSLNQIDDKDKVALREFMMREVPHIERIRFRQLTLERMTEQLDQYLSGYDQVLLDVFGGDSLLAVALYQYGLERNLPTVALDIEKGRQYEWQGGQLLVADMAIPSLSIQQMISLRGGKILHSKQPTFGPRQVAAIKKLACMAIARPHQWSAVTQFFSLAETHDLRTKKKKVLDNKGKNYHYPKDQIPLLLEAGMIRIESEEKNRVAYTFPNQVAQVFCRNKGYILELYLYLQALESELFEECSVGVEIDWNGIFPEVDNVQNEIDVILRSGHSIIFISCKMADLSVDAINELEVYASHFVGENCFKVVVCTGKINPVYANRCQEYGVLLVKGSQINHLIPILKKHLKRQRK